MEEKEKQNRSNFGKYLSNPKGFTLKRWLYELLGDKYGPHDEITERVAVGLTTQDDLEKFSKLMMQVYQEGFTKGVELYKEEAERLGLTVHVVSPKDQ